MKKRTTKEIIPGTADFVGVSCSKENTKRRKPLRLLELERCWVWWTGRRVDTQGWKKSPALKIRERKDRVFRWPRCTARKAKRNEWINKWMKVLKIFKKKNERLPVIESTAYWAAFFFVIIERPCAGAEEVKECGKETAKKKECEVLNKFNIQIKHTQTWMNVKNEEKVAQSERIRIKQRVYKAAAGSSIARSNILITLNEEEIFNPPFLSCSSTSGWASRLEREERPFQLMWSSTQNPHFFSSLSHIPPLRLLPLGCGSPKRRKHKCRRALLRGSEGENSNIISIHLVFVCPSSILVSSRVSQ